MFRLPAIKSISRRSIFAVIIVLLLAVLGLLIYFKTDFVSNRNQPKAVYRQIDSYTLAQKVKGRDMSFNKPIEVSFIGSKSTDQVVLYHRLSDGRTVAAVAASSSPVGTPLSSDNLAQYRKVLADPSNTFYSATAAAIKDFVKGRVPNGTNLTFANAVLLKSANIQANAWRFDFNGQFSQKGIRPLAGRAIFAVTSGGYYYFMAYQSSDNWKTNEAIWNRVFNSLKIDQ